MINSKQWLLMATLIFISCALAYIFYDGLAYLVHSWSREEYSHGYLIPFIAGYLFWQKSAQIPQQTSIGSQLGAWWVLAALLLWFVGELSTLYVITQYAFILTLAGISLSFFGWGGMRYLWVPLAYLVFMIPLPEFLYVKLSGQLQLISSQLGVAFMRLFDVIVHLEGNVIDLGIYRLQVVEACSGLRYLFPLTSFGFLCAYLFKGTWWQRAILFLSTIPITVLMNSFRIGVIGILVEHSGIEMAEGFLHDFEGWIIFMACVSILFGEMWLFVRLDGKGKTFSDSFALDLSLPSGGQRNNRASALPGPYIASLILLLIGGLGLQFIYHRAEIIPERQRFVSFPLQISGWSGQEVGLEQIYIDALKLDDYIIANFAHNRDPHWVNVYAAYYSSQRKGASVHSPSSCIPGGGWEITDFSQKVIEEVSQKDRSPLIVNRVVIGKGDQKQLVYYWFPQRGRHLSSEYLVKWFLFWDALTRNRTDGGLVRLVTNLPAGSRLDEADRQLVNLLGFLYPKLNKFFPD